MTSLNHARFRQELTRLFQSRPSESDLFLTRSALMWLSVAQRPLRAYELWLATLVEESKDVEHLESLLTEPGYTDEKKAAFELQRRLGGLITVTPGIEDPNRLYVALCEPDLRTFLIHLNEDPQVPDEWLQLAFSTAQAHIVAASVCMVICSVTPLHLAHVHDESVPSSLVLYGWTHWSTHLSLSGFTLENQNAAGLADSMIFGVCADVLVLLLALNDIITGPITLSTTESRTECGAIIKQAQEALERPLILLSAIVLHEGYAKTLQGARQIFDASEYSSGPSTGSKDQFGEQATDTSAPLLPNPAILPQTGAKIRSQVETLSIDKLLGQATPLFGENERQMVQGFAEIARGLRTLCMPLARPPLYKELLNQYAEDWSPLDILVNVANWMECMASYPFWQDLAAVVPRDPLKISDVNDPNYGIAALVLSRVHKDGVSKPQPPAELRRKTSPIPSAKSASGLSSLRWYTASLVEKVKGYRSGLVIGSTFTINDIRVLHQRTSSFATVPSQIIDSNDPFRFVHPLIPNSLRRLFHKRIGPFFSRVTKSGIWRSIDDFNSGALTGGTQQNWPLIKAAIVSNGYRAALADFTIAILLNHIRHILFPWLGSFMFYHPMEDLRLALSNPEVFLEEAYSYSWLWFIFSYCMLMVSDFCGGFSIGLLISNNGRPPRETLEQITNPTTVMPYLDMLMHGVKIHYLIWSFMNLEIFFARSVNAVAFAAAYYKLLAGGDAEHIALGNVIKSLWIKIPITAWQQWHIFWYGFALMAWGAVLSAITGAPGLLIAWASMWACVWAVIKYRSTFFIALEVGGMFVVAGFALMALSMLALEFIADPLGLQKTTAILRRRGIQARKCLPQGAGARAQILRRKAALPVVRQSPPKSVPSVTVEDVTGEKQD